MIYFQYFHFKKYFIKILENNFQKKKSEIFFPDF